MKKFITIFVLLNLTIFTSLIAEDKKCKTFDVGCKVGKFVSDTKEFQKKGLDESKGQLKNTADKALEVNEKMKKKYKKK